MNIIHISIYFSSLLTIYPLLRFRNIFAYAWLLSKVVRPARFPWDVIFITWNHITVCSKFSAIKKFVANIILVTSSTATNLIIIKFSSNVWQYDYRVLDFKLICDRHIQKYLSPAVTYHSQLCSNGIEHFTEIFQNQEIIVYNNILNIGEFFESTSGLLTWQICT